MSDIAAPAPVQASSRPELNAKVAPVTAIIFIVLLATGLLFTAYSLYSDVQASGVPITNYLPFLLLGVALFIALAFEFVNGFHDTANAVATVIYTHSLPAQFAVVWSGFFNFLGVLWSSGAVAFGIVSLLPVELILQVGSEAGFAMVFALLVAAIIWNLGTWALGLPGIVLAHSDRVHHRRRHYERSDARPRWHIGRRLGQGDGNRLFAAAFSACRFVCAALLLLVLKFALRNPSLYAEPKGNTPPPWWVRGLLVLTCTGVSFAHGSNDGQKGMGLIMLILIGTVPTTYALNKTPSASNMEQFRANSAAVVNIIESKTHRQIGGDPRPLISAAIALHEIDNNTLPAVGDLVRLISQQVEQFGSVSQVPASAVGNVRNDMYLASEAIRFTLKDNKLGLSPEETGKMKAYKASLDDATRFIPLWVKVATAIALGLGTMIGWKRIVVTVGEKIGKQHLTYAQGAAAELVAMSTIFAADTYGLPVSTTHVLSSGVAGTMAANGSGLQFATVRNLLLAWVLTLPMAILISGSLFWVFSKIF